MNLLDIAQSYLSDDPRDIAGVFIHRQLVAMRQWGWDIQVINSQPFGYREFQGRKRDYRPRSMRDGIVIWRPRHIWWGRNSGIGPERAYTWGVNRAVARLGYWRPHLIIADWVVPGGYAASRFASRFQVPLVIRVRGRDLLEIRRLIQRSYRMHNYYRMIFSAAERIICQGEGLFDQLIDTGLVDPHRTLALTNGVDTDYFRPATEAERDTARTMLGLAQNSQIWLFVGRWERAKGSGELAHIIPRLLAQLPEVQMLVVGPVRDFVSRAQLQNIPRVHFLGAVPPQEMLKVFRASDLFVLPSHNEGLPNSLLEAMSCGLVSVATSVGGIPYVIKDGENGYLVRPNNLQHLEQMLLRCAKQIHSLKMIMGANARKTLFVKHLDLLSTVNTLHSLLNSLIAERLFEK